MAEENVRLTQGEIIRWTVLAVVLAGAVAAYFALAPRVPQVIPVLPVETG